MYTQLVSTPDQAAIIALGAVVTLIVAGRMFHWFARTLLAVLVLLAVAAWAAPEPRLAKLHRWETDTWHEITHARFRLR